MNGSQNNQKDVFMKKNLSMIAGLFLLLTIFCNVYPQYQSYSLSEKAVIIHEQFDKNDNNWVTDNNWLSGEFNEGIYFIKCKNFNASTGLSYIQVNIDTSRNFEIESRIQMVQGVGALVFGMAADFDHYRIEMAGQQKIVVLRNFASKGKLDKLFEGTVNVLKNNEYNKITLRKEQGRYSLFINEIWVTDLKGVRFYGNYAGYSIGLQSSMMADDFNVYYLKHTPPAFTWAKPGVLKSNTSENSFSIAGEIVSESPVGKCTININEKNIEVPADSVNLALGTINKYRLHYSIPLQLGINNIKLSITNLGETITSEPRILVYQPLQPPVVTWHRPVQNNTNIETETINLKICISSASTVSSTEVFANGEPLSATIEIKPVKTEQCNAWLDITVPLIQGVNSFYVEVANAEGKTTSETRFVTFTPVRTAGEKRIALVFGNSNYSGGQKLKNPANDAQLMTATLKDLGFEVISRIDADKSTMEKAIREFSKKLGNYQVALFYYAGHGIQVDGQNFLIPVDAVLNDKSDCKFEAIAVNFIVEEFEQYPDNTNVVILDACRNNPYRSWSRGSERGFKAIAPTSGTIIAFATSEGATASDGESNNGLFTEELVRQMIVPQPIESVFKKTRIQVEKKSNFTQSPQEWSKLKGDFYFRK